MARERCTDVGGVWRRLRAKAHFNTAAARQADLNAVNTNAQNSPSRSSRRSLETFSGGKAALGFRLARCIFLLVSLDVCSGQRLPHYAQRCIICRCSTNAKAIRPADLASLGRLCRKKGARARKSPDKSHGRATNWHGSAAAGARRRGCTARRELNRRRQSGSGALCVPPRFEPR